MSFYFWAFLIYFWLDTTLCGKVCQWFSLGTPVSSTNKSDHHDQGLINPLARRPGLVIFTFGLAEIISCMPNGLVKIYIGYWQTCQYSHIYLYSYGICYMLFNQQQCFIYFLLSAKPEIVVPESDSGISFSKFAVSRHL